MPEPNQNGDRIAAPHPHVRHNLPPQGFILRPLANRHIKEHSHSLWVISPKPILWSLFLTPFLYAMDRLILADHKAPNTLHFSLHFCCIFGAIAFPLATTLAFFKSIPALLPGAEKCSVKDLSNLFASIIYILSATEVFFLLFFSIAKLFQPLTLYITQSIALEPSKIYAHCQFLQSQGLPPLTNSWDDDVKLNLSIQQNLFTFITYTPSILLASPIFKGIKHLARHYVFTTNPKSMFEPLPNNT